MFDPSTKPRIFAESCGVDYARALVDGLLARSALMHPADFARIEIYVNTARMQRRVRAMFDAGPARLLPQIRLVTDLARHPAALDIAPSVAPLRRRLELAQFVAKLLDSAPDLAPRSSLYDLADSLANLMDEMQGEGVSPATLAALDVSDQSGHWDRAKRFLDIITQFFDDSTHPPDQEARQRRVIAKLAADWAQNPPQHPIIVAGSTGSRGATALFMRAVAHLPQGAVILPGYDRDLPDAVWAAMDDVLTHEDHPQFRFRRLMDLIGFSPADVAPWSGHQPAQPARNALVSLSLRPAPVTNQWLTEGPLLGDLAAATAQITLVEASSPRVEAEAIALRLRAAVQEGITAALITPDRNLTRQVTAALDRWDIRPDDSAGIPLAQSAPGRFLRHCADLFGQTLTAEALLVLLKHPLCHSGGADRGDHLRLTHDLELHLRRWGPPFPTADSLLAFAGDQADRQVWAIWLAELITGLDSAGDQPLAQHLDAHLTLAARLCAGPMTDGAGGLWDQTAGREAARICTQLHDHADAGGVMSPRDYAALIGRVLAAGVVREPDSGHPQVLFWGTLESRVQSADLTILGGMNDGIWPEAPPPDPWLNRMMRAQAGLLLPERKVGLSAHDYQQAVAGAQVWITRAKRSADAETVPSRWINRLTNLLHGLPDQGGRDALDAMRARGDRWLAMAAKLASPQTSTPRAPRPAPCPPLAARPDKISVTQIKTLIRDPYAIYAQKVLRLQRLDPLTPQADAPLRGTIIHEILEKFIAQGHSADDKAALMALARATFAQRCPWPTFRAQWLAQFEIAADAFLAAEAARRDLAPTRRTELEGEMAVADTGVRITCKADRIDLAADGRAFIYDYKTGILPTKPQQERFDKQLLVEAVMVEHGAFVDLGPRPVAQAAFISIKPDAKTMPAPLDANPTAQVWTDLQALLLYWRAPTSGYTARYALFSKDDTSPYDHLARYGEWDASDLPQKQVLT